MGGGRERERKGREVAGRRGSRPEEWVGVGCGVGDRGEEEMGSPESRSGREGKKKRGGVGTIKRRDEFPPVTWWIYLAERKKCGHKVKGPQTQHTINTCCKWVASPSFSFFPPTVVEIHSCKSWKSWTAAILLLCEPLRGSWGQMLLAPTDLLQGGRYRSKVATFLDANTHRGGQTGGHLPDLFWLGFWGKEDTSDYLSMQTQTKNLRYCRINNHQCQGCIYTRPHHTHTDTHTHSLTNLSICLVTTH